MSPPVVGHSGPGPFAGTDPREAARVVLGECPALPFLPELPARGLGADQVGRTAAMVADLPVDVSPRGWRLAGSPGRVARRAVDLLDRDADALEEADELARGVTVDRTLARDGDIPSSAGPDRRLQIRVLGPWSLAARLELPGGLLTLTDRGARRDLAAALAEGVASRAVRLAGRLGTGTRILLDEPLLWNVAAGTVAGASRFDPIPAVHTDQLSLSLCRFAETLRASGVDEVVVRVPERGGPDSPPQWAAVTGAPRGEVALDGLCITAASLHLPSGVAESERADADVAQSEVHAALDAAGAVLGDGRLLQFEGLPGAARPPVSGPEHERAVEGILRLLDRLAAPRHASLGQLVLTPTVAEMTRDTASGTAALAAVRRVAHSAPSRAE